MELTLRSFAVLLALFLLAAGVSWGAPGRSASPVVTRSLLARDRFDPFDLLRFLLFSSVQFSAL